MSKIRLLSMVHAAAESFVVIVVLALGQHAHAQTKTWTGGGGNFSWHNPDNWSPVGEPEASDDVLIDVTGEVTVTIGQTASARAIVLANDLEITNSTLTINDGLTLNNSTVTLTTAQSNAMLRFSGGTQTLGGTGEVLLNNQLGSNSTTVEPFDSATLIIGRNITIRRVAPGTNVNALAIIGSTIPNTAVISQGTIVSETPGRRIDLYGDFANEGVIQGHNGGSVAIIGSNSQFTNKGTMHVEESALTLGGYWVNLGTITAINSTVSLNGNFTLSALGAFDRSGGTVTVTGILDLDGSNLHLDDVTGSWAVNGGTIANGTISTSGSAELRVIGNSTFDGVTLSTDVEIVKSMLLIYNDLTLNNSTLTLTSDGGATTLRFTAGTQTLGGTGQVLLNNQVTSYNTTVEPRVGATLVIGPDITIRRVGPGNSIASIGSSSSNSATINQGTIISETNDREVRLVGNFTNEGVIQAINGGIVATAGSNSQFTNEGTVQVEDSGLRLSGNWVNLGTITAINSIVHLGGDFTLSALGTFIRSGGAVNFTGTIDLEGSNLHLDDVTGSWNIDGGTIANGTISTSGSAELLITSNSAFDNVTVATDVEIVNRTLTIRNGLTLDNATITLTTAHGSASLEFVGGTQTLGGTGQVLMNNQATSHNTRVRTGINATLIIGPDITVRRVGPGTNASALAIIGSTTSNTAVISQGTIVSETSSRTIELQGDFTNEGEIKAINGGVVTLPGEWTSSGTITAVQSVLNLGGNFTYSTMGSITQTDGTVNITGILDLEGSNLHLDDVTGSWTLNGGTIANGTISSSGLAQLLITSGGTLDSVTLAMDVEIVNTYLTINNGLTLDNSTVKLTSNGSSASLGFTGGGKQTLGGTGHVLLHAITQSTTVVPHSNTTLIIGPDITVRRTGPGISGANIGSTSSSTATINRGTIISETPDSRVELRGHFTNEGLILAINGGFVTMYEGNSFTNKGTIQVEESTLWIGGDWVNLGTMTAINSTVSLNGNFTLSALGTFIRSGGTFNVTGNLDLEGSNLHLDDVTGSWIMDGGTIANGTISTSGSAELLILSNSTFDCVILATDIELVSRTLNIRNGLTLDNSTVTLTADFHNAWLRFIGGTQTLGGTGQVLMNNQAAMRNTTVDANSHTTLIIGPDITIRRVGSGSSPSALAIIGSTVSTAAVINEGTIISEVMGSTIDLRGDFTNEGVIHVINGGIVTMTGINSQFTNEGTVQVVDTELTLGGDWLNLGTITANDSVVNLGGNFTLTTLGTFKRSGGTVNLTGLLDLEDSDLHLDDVTGSWTLNGGKIANGTIRATGLAELLITSFGMLDGVTLRVDLELNDVTLTINNGLTLQEVTLTLTSNGGISTLRFIGGTQTLGGTGQVLMNNQSGSNNTTVETSNYMALIIGRDITIRRVGPGASPDALAIIGSTGTSAAVINQGSIISETNNRDVRLQGNFINEGVIQTINGGIVTTGTSQFTNEGTVAAADGSITIDSPLFMNYTNGTLSGGRWEIGPGSVLDLPSGVNIHTLGGGAAVKLFGEDSHFSAITNLTTLAAGTSLQLSDGRQFSATPQGGTFTNLGSLTVDQNSRFTTAANYAQGSSGVLHVGIASSIPPAPVAAAATQLDGQLLVEFFDGFAPSLGEGVLVLSGSAGVSGEFATVSHPMSHPCMYEVVYGPTSVSAALETMPPVAVCQNIVVQLNSAGQATITAMDVDGGSSDNCQIQSMSVSLDSFTCFNVGTNLVTLTVVDAAGNIDTCEAIVTVLATDHYLGSLGDSWFDAGSWCTGAPTLETPVILGDLVHVDSLGAHAQRVQVIAGGELVIGAEGGASLEVAETVTVEAGGAVSLIEGGLLTASSLLIEAGGVLNITNPTARLVLDDLMIAQGATLNWLAGTLEIRGVWLHDSTIQVGCEAMAAALIVDSGLIIAPNVAICVDGTLGGNGVIAAAVSSDGFVSPGLSSGMLLIQGDYAQTAKGELLIEIGGLEPSVEHDVFDVTGQGTLGGLLRVELIDGFMPAWADSFTVMTAGSLSDGFDAVVLPELNSPLSTSIDVTTTAVVIKVDRLGDLNGDGVVGVSDLLILLAAWSACPDCGDCPADLNGDCAVDVSDLLVLLANWG